MTPPVQLSSWSEDQLLDLCWAMLRHDTDRLETLRKFSNVAVRRDGDWDREAIRAAILPAKPDQCFVCLTVERWVYWHHIIQVQYGGSNSVGNLVAVCKRCHARIHPWLDRGNSLEERGGMVMAADLIPKTMRWLERVLLRKA